MHNKESKKYLPKMRHLPPLRKKPLMDVELFLERNSIKVPRSEISRRQRRHLYRPLRTFAS